MKSDKVSGCVVRESECESACERVRARVSECESEWELARVSECESK